MDVLHLCCRPSDISWFIGELQAQAGIVDPIDGFFFVTIGMQPIPSLSPLASVRRSRLLPCSRNLELFSGQRSSTSIALESIFVLRSVRSFVRTHSTWWCVPSFHRHTANPSSIDRPSIFHSRRVTLLLADDLHCRHSLAG